MSAKSHAVRRGIRLAQPAGMRTMPAAVVLAFALLAPPDAAAQRPQPPETFAGVVETLKPAVLSVAMPAPPDIEEIDDDALTPGDALRRFFEALTTLPNRTLGAAVVVDPSGIAVTGLRLLRGHSEVEVVDVDGRRARATVVGRDDRTDLAILRIAGAGPWPVARFGDSDRVRVGDWVIALGSPYGFEASVSAGIVSGRPRPWAGAKAGTADMLQTDAAINPGSAGGPLVSPRGEVIGVSSIAAPRGSGIAFAVPSNVVRAVVADLVAHGKVIRGWLGIEPQLMTPELARAFRVPAVGGLLVADVIPGSPVARAGLTRGAVVLALDGRPLRELADLEHALAATAPGRPATLHVWRDGRESTVRLTIGQDPGSVPPTERVHGLGFIVEGVTPEIGVVIAGVRAGTPAATAGLLRGDLVRELNRHPVRTLTDYDEVAPSVGRDGVATVLVQRGRTSLYLVLSAEP